MPEMVTSLSLLPCLSRASCYQVFRAFTLVELLVVLVLIGVMASSVIVALDNREDGHALRVAADDLATAIRFASREADVTQRPHRLVFANDMRSYWVEIVSGSARLEYVPVRGVAGRPRPLAKSVSIVSILPADQVVTGPTIKMLDFASGGTKFAGDIRLSTGTKRTLVVEVAAKTGQVHVVE